MNNLKDILDQVNIVDSLKVNDTLKVIDYIPLTASTKINSEDGAIIPKQVLQASKIGPSILIEKEENANLPFYFLIGFGVLVLIMFFKFFKRKSKKNRG